MLRCSGLSIVSAFIELFRLSMISSTREHGFETGATVAGSLLLSIWYWLFRPSSSSDCRLPVAGLVHQHDEHLYWQKSWWNYHYCSIQTRPVGSKVVSDEKSAPRWFIYCWWWEVCALIVVSSLLHLSVHSEVAMMTFLFKNNTVSRFLLMDDEHKNIQKSNKQNLYGKIFRRADIPSLSSMSHRPVFVYRWEDHAGLGFPPCKVQILVFTEDWWRILVFFPSLLWSEDCSETLMRR